MAATEHRLVIVRHAKSAWPDGVPDVHRPLGPRGRRDAPAIGRWLRDQVGHVDIVVCSPAERARRTWELVAGVLGSAAPGARFDDRVYAASAGQLLAVVQGLPDTAAIAVLVGHNPGLEDLVELLTGALCELKTSGIAVVRLPAPWTRAGAGRARLAGHATPRG